MCGISVSYGISTPSSGIFASSRTLKSSLTVSVKTWSWLRWRTPRRRETRCTKQKRPLRHWSWAAKPSDTWRWTTFYRWNAQALFFKKKKKKVQSVVLAACSSSNWALVTLKHNFTPLLLEKYRIEQIKTTKSKSFIFIDKSKKFFWQINVLQAKKKFEILDAVSHMWSFYYLSVLCVWFTFDCILIPPADVVFHACPVHIIPTRI